MKQLYQYKPGFNPTTQTLDFTGLPNFSINKLYAVVNVTRSTIMYAPGVASLGATSVSGNVVTLACNTTSYSSTDLLNVYYEAAPGSESNTPMEVGGQLQMIQESLNQILIELKVQTFLFSDGWNRTTNIRYDEIEQLRDDINNPQNSITTAT
jgi:hypothetical protein